MFSSVFNVAGHNLKSQLKKERTGKELPAGKAAVDGAIGASLLNLPMPQDRILTHLYSSHPSGQPPRSARRPSGRNLPPSLE